MSGHGGQTQDAKALLRRTEGNNAYEVCKLCQEIPVGAFGYKS